MRKKWARLHGTVLKVIPPRLPSEPEKIEIVIHEADPLYKEIRLVNNLVDAAGNRAILAPGSSVDVFVEANMDSKTKVAARLLQSVV